MHYDYHIVYKPYQVLSQFTSADGKQCLKDVFQVKRNVYPVGRLDYDSEGLLMLTNDASLNHKLLHPGFLHRRTYLAQVEGAVTDAALNTLQQGITITIDGKAYRTAPCSAVRLSEEPEVPQRNPPIRYRKNIPVCWVKITLTEGKNRQVRKMLATVGFPVLRLIRYAIENITLGDMQPGDIKTLPVNTINKQLFGK